MKPKANLRHFLALAGSSLLAMSFAHAATVNWNGSTSATWATSGNWDTAPANSLTADIANFNLATYDGVTVFAPTVGTATSINGITIGASNGTMTLTNTAALSIGASGINIASGAGAFTISGSTTLGAAQSWINNSTNLFTFGAVTTGGNLLTIGGSGNTTASGIISGTNGALTKEGAGLLTLNAANTYTGATTVNGGELRWGVANAIAGGALNINNGGTVNMQDKTDTVGTVTIAQGGSITGTTGTLTPSSFISNDGGTMTGATLSLATSAGLTYNSTGPGSTTLQIDRISVTDSGSNTFNIADGDAAVDFDITGFVNNGGNNVSRTIFKTGAGAMQFSGSTLGGTGQNGIFLNINEGTVLMNRATGVAFAPGSNHAITVGDSTGSVGTAILKFASTGGDNQLGTRAITINSDGLFDLNGKTQSTGNAVTLNGTGQLQLNNGQLTATSLTLNPSSGNTTSLSLGGTGILTLGGDVTLNASGSGRAQITGSDLSLGAANRIFNIGLGSGADYDLLVGAGISGARSLTKNGLGRLVLTGSNSYTLGTTVNAGTLQIGDGTTAGTMTSTGALTLGNATFAVRGPASGGSSQTVASLATTASTGSTIRITPGTGGNTTLTITSNTLSTGAGSALNFNYAAGTTVGGTLGNNYVVWNPTLTGGIIGAAYTVTDSGGTGFATTSGGNVVRLTDPGGAGLPDSVGSGTGSYFIGSGYSTDTTTTPGSLVLALSGAVAASNVTVNTSGLASGANLALGTNLLTLGAGMVFDGPNAYEISGSGAGGLRAAASGGTINLYNANTSTVTISAPIVANGASRLTMDGPGTTILSGVNTYTGATVLNGGITRFSGTMAASAVTINNGVAQLGTATGLTSSNSVTFGAGSTGSLQLLGNSVTIGALSSNATLGAPVITNNNGGGAVANATLTIDSASSTTFGGVIQDGTGGGTLALTKSGAGKLTLSGVNTYSGGTTINAGEVSVTADANLGDASGGITLAGGRLSASAVTTARIVTVNGTGSSIYVVKNSTFTTSGKLTGAGTLSLLDPGGSGSAPVYNFNSTSNDFTGTIISNNGVLGVNSLIDSSNNIVFNSTNNSGNEVDVAALRLGSGAIAALTLNSRSIEFNSAVTSRLFIRNDNTTHAINIGTNLIATGAGAKTLWLNAVAGPTNVFSGIITNATDAGSGTMAVTKIGAGTWSLSNASNSYTGGTIVSAGTLGFANGALGSSGTINASGGTLLWNTGNTQDISSRLAMTAATTTTLNTNGNNVAFANPIGGSTTGALTKAGAGTLLLNGTNTYTGLTTVNDGTLGGSCTIGGAVTVNAAGSLAPGASAGTLAITGALTLTNQLSGGTGKLKFELGSIASSDKITVGGNLTIGTAQLAFNDFEFSTLSGLQDGTYTLLTYTGTLSGSIAASGLSGVISGVGGSGNATLNLDTVNKRLELIVTDTGGGGDIIPPTLASSAIVDDKSGGPVTVGTLVTYTVTFSEDMDAGTVSAADFGNAGSAAVTIGSVSETSPGVFTVQATPTSTGTLQLRVNAGAVLTDTSANPLDTTSAIADNTIITVQSLYDAWSGGAGFDADANGDGVDNGLAFLLGAANKDVSALGLLPTVSQSGGNLVMTFKCRKDAYRGSALLNVEHSSNLGISDAWLGAPVTDAGSPLNNVSFSVSSFSTELNSVTATISSSEAASGKLFGRLKGTNP